MDIKIFKGISFLALFVLVAFPVASFAAGPSAINLGSAGDFVILSKTGISTTGSTSIVGDIGVSPAQATAITGFALDLPASGSYSTSALITGKIYAPGYVDPTPANMTTAISNMETAYSDGAGRTNPTATELGAGNIGGMTLAPGLYKWSSGLIIPSDVTLSGSADDVWIFQVAQNLEISSNVKIILAGGAQAGNIFWVVAGQTTIGTGATFSGNILGQTAIVLNTGAILNGRALAQTAVTLDANAVTKPILIVAAPATTPTPVAAIIPAVPATPAVSATPISVTSAYTTTATPAIPATPPSISDQDRLNELTVIFKSLQSQYEARMRAVSSGISDQDKLNDLVSNLKSLQAQQATGQGAPVSSAFGQQVRAIAVSLNQGSKNNDVATLQGFLISQNKGPAAAALAKVGSTSYFGGLTRAALAEFQEKTGINPPLGNFGPITRAYIKANY